MVALAREAVKQLSFAAAGLRAETRFDSGESRALLCHPVNKAGTNPSFPTVVAVIPARYTSLRLPGKPLLEIGGRAMILHVLDRAREARHVARALIATDDERVLRAVLADGGEAVMTSDAHRSGTDRIAEVVADLPPEVEIVVNVQGDEPLISPRTIDAAVEAMIDDEEADIATTSERIEHRKDVLSPDVVKVVTDEAGRALFFSRSPIPYPRDAARRHGSLAAALDADDTLLGGFRKHTGLYVYRREFLLRYAAWPPSRLERGESLEQMRALERGAKIVVVEADEPSIGVDTAQDLERVRRIMERRT